MQANAKKKTTRIINIFQYNEDNLKISAKNYFRLNILEKFIVNINSSNTTYSTLQDKYYILIIIVKYELSSFLYYFYIKIPNE